MDPVKRFFELSSGRLDKVSELLSAILEAKTEEREKRLFDARMELHTIKGDSGMLNIKKLVDYMNDLDSRMAATTFSKAEIDEMFEGIRHVRQVLDRIEKKYSRQEHAQAGASKPEETA